jgi:hypothetical protein
MSFLSEPITLFPIRPNRTIGGITGYVTVDENATDKLTVTRQPVQQGASISDHAYKEPTELSVRIVAGPQLLKPLSEIYKDFLKLQSDRTKFDCVTGKRSYTNMVLLSIGQTTDKTTENVLALNLTLLEVITVEVTPTKVPPRSRQKNAATTGATEKGGKKSALKVLKEGIGNLFGGG